ncbi:Dabb family protein [Sulfurimonas sp.]|nr:Dabb family protein [Sulfurimonas sp.]
MIVHIVMFRFKDENKDANIVEVTARLNALLELIPSLNSMEVGIDFSKSERAFDMSIYTTFDSKEALGEYAVHPEHIKVVEIIREVTSESKVVDYIKD